ncbi:MAG: META domain-containing protein [Pirellula sp.]|jgi:heat shock protein HslJ/phosphoserine phosphatase
MKIFAIALSVLCCHFLVAHADDPLPSWRESASKRQIIQFVERVTTKGTPDFVPITDRIAVFDNDGTLCCEAPIPIQATYAFDEVKRLSVIEPKLKEDPMVQAALSGDIAKLLEGEHHDGLLKILALTHAGITTTEFEERVRNWFSTARHPRFNKPYSDLVYQPMVELLKYLRANGFKTFIVSGGGADFIRVWSEQVYGIPPENVIGSTGQTKFEIRDGKPVLIKTLDYVFVNDKEGKPVAIHQHIGRRPIACFGNSDGDLAMLKYTTIHNPRPSFGLIVHHTDGEREYAYDAAPPSSGKLVTALQGAPIYGWSVVNMKRDWEKVWNESASASGVPLGKWLVEDIGGHGVVDSAQSTIEFSADDTVSGDTCVNRFNGKLEYDGTTLKMGPLATTRRAGPDALMDQESRFVVALTQIRRFRLDESGFLFLFDADGNELMRLSKIESK